MSKDEKFSFSGHKKLMHRGLQVSNESYQLLSDVIQDCAKDVIAHRLILNSDAAYSGENGRSHVQQLLDDVPVPA